MGSAAQRQRERRRWSLQRFVASERRLAAAASTVLGSDGRRRPWRLLLFVLGRQCEWRQREPWELRLGSGVCQHCSFLPSPLPPSQIVHPLVLMRRVCCDQLPSSSSAAGAPSSSPRAGQQTPRGGAALPPRPPGAPPAAALARQQSAPYGAGSATPGGSGGAGFGLPGDTPGGGNGAAYAEHSTPHVASSAQGPSTSSPWPTPANDKQLDRQALLARQASAPGALGGGGGSGGALPPRPTGPAPGSAPARPLGKQADGIMGAGPGLALDLTGGVGGPGNGVVGGGRPTPRPSPRSGSTCALPRSLASLAHASCLMPRRQLCPYCMRPHADLDTDCLPLHVCSWTRTEGTTESLSL